MVQGRSGFADVVRRQDGVKVSSLDQAADRLRVEFFSESAYLRIRSQVRQPKLSEFRLEKGGHWRRRSSQGWNHEQCFNCTFKS